MGSVFILDRQVLPNVPMDARRSILRQALAAPGRNGHLNVGATSVKRFFVLAYVEGYADTVDVIEKGGVVYVALE